MAIITGYDCSITIADNTFDNVVGSFELSFDSDNLVYNTFEGPRAVSGSESGTLNISFAYDSGDTPSLFDSLWTANKTNVVYTVTAGASTFTGSAVANRPGVPASADAVVECSVELGLDGMPTMAPATKKTAIK